MSTIKATTLRTLMQNGKSDEVGKFENPLLQLTYNTNHKTFQIYINGDIDNEQEYKDSIIEELKLKGKKFDGKRLKFGLDDITRDHFQQQGLTRIVELCDLHSDDDATRNAALQKILTTAEAEVGQPDKSSLFFTADTINGDQYVGQLPGRPSKAKEISVAFDPRNVLHDAFAQSARDVLDAALKKHIKNLVSGDRRATLLSTIISTADCECLITSTRAALERAQTARAPSLAAPTAPTATLYFSTSDAARPDAGTPDSLRLSSSSTQRSGTAQPDVRAPDPFAMSSSSASAPAFPTTPPAQQEIHIFPTL